MKKCDVIIPVYKSPEWVKLCIYALFKNTNEKVLGTVYLVNDCDDELTKNCLNNLADKYPKIKILKNEKNLGFIKTTNKGLKESKADYALLLNTDCIIAENTISKLIKHIEKNKKIGLICPISSNAANLTLEMFEGYSYMQMDKLLERKFSGMCFDACTVVGNCLLITRECLDKTGYLDEAYGTGYGEETDYQFKAMKHGFEAKVAIDTYVFHKSEVSFGTSKEKQEKLNKNRQLFFSRWGGEYNRLMEKYIKNDPIKYINDNITEKDKKLDFEFLTYLIGFSQNAGGVHTVVDMINYLSINGVNCNIIYSFFNKYDEILLFKPIEIENLKKFNFNKIVSTLYYSTYFCKNIAEKYNVPLIYFAQGYEPYFENGADYGVAELSYKLPDKILTVSEYLKNRYMDMFATDSVVIDNGINYDLLFHNNNNNKIKTITFTLRNNPLKGDFILIDLIKKISQKYTNLEINIMYSNDKIVFPFNDNQTIKINKYMGPLSRKEIASILQNSDIFIDASFTEGFGLMALEAMAAGNIPIVSNSGGICEYIEHEENGFIIDDVNNIYHYIEILDRLINDNKLYKEIKANCEKTAKEYDYDKIVDSYIKFFRKEIKIKNNILNEEEKELYNIVLNKRFRIDKKNKTNNFLYKICKLVPKRIRIAIKKVIEKIYKFTNER